jgi:ABC-2 type transport system permease protein
MTGAFAGGWAGMGVIEDLNRGVIDRFLVSPVARQALITGRLVQLAIVSVIQSAIVITLGLLAGAHVPRRRHRPGRPGRQLGPARGVAWRPLQRHGPAGPQGGDGDRRLQLRAAPLTFLSSAFMQRNLVPGWIQTISRYNPVEWTVTRAARPSPPSRTGAWS